MVKWSNYLQLEAYRSALGTGRLQAGSGLPASPVAAGCVLPAPCGQEDQRRALGPVQPAAERGEAAPILSLLGEWEAGGAEPGQGCGLSVRWEAPALGAREGQDGISGHNKGWISGHDKCWGEALFGVGDSCVPQDLKSCTPLGLSPNVRPGGQAGTSQFGSACLIGDSPTSAFYNDSRSEGTFTYGYRISFNQIC